MLGMERVLENYVRHRKEYQRNMQDIGRNITILENSVRHRKEYQINMQDTGKSIRDLC